MLGKKGVICEIELPEYSDNLRNTFDNESGVVKVNKNNASASDTTLE